MKKYKGFTFVELMLVLLVLGIIIMLTIPLLKNLKDDQKIYRAYMKKANQDVTDAVSMAFIKNSALTGFDKLGNIGWADNAADYDANSLGIRTAITTAVNGKLCAGKTCLNDPFVEDAPGLILPGKSVMMFNYNYTAATASKEATYGFIYIDMNGDKSPNELCQDRYKFELYADRAVMVDCDLAL